MKKKGGGKKGLNIVILSDSPWVSTGHARVVRELGAYWKNRGHKVFSLAWNTSHGADESAELYDQEWPTAYMKSGYGFADNGIEELFEILGLGDLPPPDILFCVGDLMHFTGIRRIKDAFPQTLVYGYINVDGDYLPPSFESVVCGFGSSRSITD